MTLCADDAPEAQVQTEAAKDAQAGGQPVDLHVPVQRLLAQGGGRLAFGIEAAGQVGDRPLEALRDGREVLLVAGDQRRVGLGGEPVRKVKRAGGHGIHGISSDLRPLAADARGRRHADTGGLSRLTASSSSVAATVAPSVRIVPATAVARARVWGVRAVRSAADRDSVVGAVLSWAAPMPRSATRPAQYGWSPH